MAFAAPRNFSAFGDFVARDPFRQLVRFQRTLSPSGPAASRAFVPQVDAVEDEDAFRITAEVPGVAEADLSVEIEEGVLTLKGEKKSYLDSSSEEKSSARLHCAETRYGAFERRLRFNAEVDAEAVKASYGNGVLTIVVPKVAESVPEVRTIPVESA